MTDEYPESVTLEMLAYSRYGAEPGCRAAGPWHHNPYIINIEQDNWTGDRARPISIAGRCATVRPCTMVHVRDARNMHY